MEKMAKTAILIPPKLMTNHSPATDDSAFKAPEAGPMPQSSEELSKSAPENDPTFVKLAMRNMVRKGSKSLFHFALTTVGLLGLLVGLAFVTH